jgi:hypothetical protein
VTERRMVADLYVFDIETFVWEKVQYAPTDNVPQPRYFHSADACKYSTCCNTAKTLMDTQGTTTWLYSVE